MQAQYADGQGASQATTVSLPRTANYQTFAHADASVWLDSGALTGATSLQWSSGNLIDDQTEGCNTVTITPQTSTQAYLDDMDWYGTASGS